MSVTVNPGVYDGKTVAATIYEAPSGAVMCRMQLDLGGVLLTGGICLVQKDGALSERGFRDVQAILGWSDWDWSRWNEEPESFAGFDCQVVVETVKGDRGGEFSSVKYINPPGGGNRLERADTRALAAKYGAKTRALFGGGAPAAGVTPAKAQGAAGAAGGAGVAARPPPPPPPVVLPPPPVVPAVVSSMEKCWEEFCRENEGKAEHELYAAWHERVREATGKGQNECGPEDWGMVYASFNLLPM